MYGKKHNILYKFFHQFIQFFISQTRKSELGSQFRIRDSRQMTRAARQVHHSSVSLQNGEENVTHSFGVEEVCCNSFDRFFVVI